MKFVLNFAIIADNAFTDTAGRLSIVQTFSEIKGSKFPATHPRLAVVTNFTTEEIEEGENILHQVRILSPTDQLISEVKIDKPATGSELQFISYFIGLIFPKAGKHKIKILLNGKMYKELYLEVKQE